MRNLQNFGVQELSTKEIRETQGGGPIADFVHWFVHLDWSMEEHGRRLLRNGSPGGAK